MRLFRASKNAFVLHLDKGERRVFVHVLEQYPVVPEAYQQITRSRSSSDDDEHQQLLNEALAEQRAALREQVQSWLNAKNRFRRVAHGFNFTLKRTDANWFLQVLNDIRVGCWLRLGSPDPIPSMEELVGQPSERVQLWVMMELSGHFQMELLQAIESLPEG